MPALPTPSFNVTVDIWTGDALNLGPGQIRVQAVKAQIFSAFGSGARSSISEVRDLPPYTHVVLFTADTDVRDDWTGPDVVALPVKADWIAFPAGRIPCLRVQLVERRLLGSPDAYIRAYCCRGSIVGQAPPV